MKNTSNIVVIILLIVFFPVGLYLMWKKTDWKKPIKIVVTVVIAILVIVYSISAANMGNGEEDKSVPSPSISQSSETSIQELKFLRNETIELELGDNKFKSNENSYFTVKPKENFKIDDIEFISENPSVATFTYDKTVLDDCIYYNVDAVNPGETYIYVQTKDKSITSEKLKVTVIQGETTTEATTKETTTKKETATKKAITTKKKNKTTKSAKKNDKTVYITPTGKRYHYSKSCAGKNAMKRNLSDVKGAYSPCKKCA